MLIRILAAAAVTLTMGASAFAQDSDTNHPPVPWLDTPAAEAFFSDKEGMMMRSDEEMKMNYGKMSADEQMKVKEGCKAMNSGSMDPAANSTTGGDGPAATGGGTGTHTQDVGMNVKKVCDMVGAM